MAILKLTDAATKATLKHPLIKDKARIGRGAFCVVLDNQHSVFKLTLDSYQYHLYTHKERPQSEYFPTLIKDYGVVGGSDTEPLYLVEMEKLSAFKRKVDAPRKAWEQRRSLHKVLDAHRRKVWMKFDGENADSEIVIACLRGVQEYDCIEKGLQVAACQLADFCELMACSPDLHRSNFMFRDSQLVFNDVVKDQYAVYRKTLLDTMSPELVAPYLAYKAARRSEQMAIDSTKAEPKA